MVQTLLPRASLVTEWAVVGAASAHLALQVQDQVATRIETDDIGAIVEVLLEEGAGPLQAGEWRVFLEYRVSGVMISVKGSEFGWRLRARLKAGTEVLHEWDAPEVAGTAWLTHEVVVPAAAVAGVSALNDLRLELEDALTIPLALGKLQVSYARLQVPDPQPPPPPPPGDPSLGAVVELAASVLAPQGIAGQAVWP